jgi:guanylate kinase
MKVIGPRAMMYLAHPTRVWKAGGSDRIVQFARQKGFAPVNPFLCGDFQDFEGGLVGREGTLRWTLHLQRGCHWSGYFGISEGVMRELEDRLEWDTERHMRVFYEDEQGMPFDEKWQAEYERLKGKYGDLLAELRGRNRLIAFVGPSAVGKTYWIEHLMQLYGNSLQRVKNTTTRPPRDANDERYYHRVSLEQFNDGIDGHEFLEHDRYLGHYYGSSLAEIRRALQSHHGIFAVTPKGAMELYRCRFEINVSIVLLRPVNEAVLVKNFQRRGEKNSEKIAESLRRASEFRLPAHVEHQVLELTGTRVDEQRVFDLFAPLMK